jgi:hypothetical protein
MRLPSVLAVVVGVVFLWLMGLGMIAQADEGMYLLNNPPRELLKKKWA